ncbi:Max-binding protein MNT [Labeo rohita]|uniref:Max-binding protein MNT n=1 Tax=Labeo rohita TaxID=84645 RepID=A0ABQ8M059_LABRO|nr:Max-binding protein MNT [Labeo rohita]
MHSCGLELRLMQHTDQRAVNMPHQRWEGLSCYCSCVLIACLFLMRQLTVQGNWVAYAQPNVCRVLPSIPPFSLYLVRTRAHQANAFPEVGGAVMPWTLKRKEKDYEHEMERLAREKIALQQRLAELKNELSQRLDVMEIDQGEDNIDEDIEGETPSALPKVPAALQPDLKKPRPASSLITQPIPIQHKPSKTLPPIPSAQLSPIAAAAPITAPALTSTPAQAPNGPASAPATQVVTPQTLPPAQTHIVTAASLQPSVIAHAGSASHASVIQTVNRVIQPGSKHVAHIAPSSSSSVQLAPGPQSISHITVAHLPAIYPQPVTVTQPAVMSHIAQTLSHAQMNGTAVTNAQAKQTPVGAQMVTHHPQLVGQTVLNPVTMVTMPSFPVSTLKLA